MQISGTLKKLASLVPWRQNAKWWKFSTESTVTGQIYIWYQIFLDIPTAHEHVFFFFVDRWCVPGSTGETDIWKNDVILWGGKMCL